MLKGERPALTMTVGALLSSKLSHDNPYWQRRHPQQAAREGEAADALPDSGRMRHPLPVTRRPEGAGDGRAPAWRPPTRGKR